MKVHFDNFFSLIFIIILFVSLFPTISNAWGKLNNPIVTLDIPLGIASGDVTNKSIILWSKTNSSAIMNIEVSKNGSFEYPLQYSMMVNESTDFVGHHKINNLEPDTRYIYGIWFSDIENPSLNSKKITGTFKTAPSSQMERNITFAVGGDLGGQGYCKRPDIGYSIFTVIRNLNPDFFVANGDMIYADDTCPKNGPQNSKGWINIPGDFKSILDTTIDWENLTQVKEIYEKHWMYNKNDSHYQKLYQNIPVYSQSDDHEIADNYSGNSTFYNNQTQDRKGFKNIVREGWNSFFNYSPVEISPQEPTRIFKKINWGQNMDLFILDSHQYRSQGLVLDNEQNKTLLGNTQLEWLKRGLINSNSTWKVILNDVPVSIPHCANNFSGCDNWATDNKSQYTFSKERYEFFKFLDEKNIKNIVFVVTDAHYPSSILIKNDFDGDGDELRIYEFVSGPLQAATLDPVLLDPTINATYLYTDNGFFNFGLYNIHKGIDNKTHFISEIWTNDGLSKKGSAIDLTPQ